MLVLSNTKPRKTKMTMSSLITNTPVNPDTFVSVMNDHWGSNLNNAVSSKLQETWRLLVTTFNSSIYDSTLDVSDQWKVLQPPTGSGKTQGLIIYLSMLSEADPDVGALIVVRLKAQADDVVDQINKRTRQDIAIAKHSGTETSIEEASTKQVLVITHAAYENSLEALSEGTSTAFKNHMNFNGVDRSLVVIDEAIDIVRTSRLELNSLKALEGQIPIEVTDEYPREIKSLQLLRQMLIDVRAVQKSDGHKSAMLWAEQKGLVSVLPLIKGLKSQRWDHRLFKRHDSNFQREFTKDIVEKLNAADELIAGFAWYSKQGTEHSLNTAKLILPESVSSGVVLDATASQNLIWELFGDKAKIIATPKGVRDYSNVTLHVSRHQGVGKGKMLKEANKRSALLMTDLPKRIPSSHRVLIVCHKGLVEHLKQFKHSFKGLAVTNWGAIDGRNDWDNYESVVIYGLPYRSPIDSRNAFMAVQGPQNSEWLSSKEKRGFNGHTDVLSAIENGYLTVSTVQAMNRIRCRRVIDTNGSCKKSDVFLVLPTDSAGDAVLGAIKKEMPGIQEDVWEFPGFESKPPGRPKKSAAALALITWVKGAMAGAYTAREVKESTGIKRSAWDRLVKEMKDAGSELCESLKEADAILVTSGKGSRSYLVVN